MHDRYWREMGTLATDKITQKILPKKYMLPEEWGILGTICRGCSNNTKYFLVVCDWRRTGGNGN